jgi:hypothetical protein
MNKKAPALQRKIMFLRTTMGGPKSHLRSEMFSVMDELDLS